MRRYGALDRTSSLNEKVDSKNGYACSIELSK